MPLVLNLETVQSAALRESDANYRDLEGAAFRHRIDRREDHLVGEISRHTEEHHRV
jgi:hypothetical protein